MLKLVIDSVDDIPEGMSTAYEEKGGKFHLKLTDEVVPKSQVTEFRNNNINLLKEKEELAAKLGKFDGVDMEAYNKALKAAQDAADNKLLDAGKVDEVVDKRTERMRADFEGQTAALNTRIEALTGDKDKLTGQLSNVLIDSQIQQAINEVGKPRAGATQDILSRGRSLFKLIEGKPVPVGVDGNPIFGKDGKAPMTFTEWATGLKESAGFLFDSASGGGAAGNLSGGKQVVSKTIASGDPVAFGDNLADIAAGKVAVSQ
jgi:hypothetical protein